MFLSGELAAVKASGEAFDQLDALNIDTYGGLVFSPTAKFGAQLLKNLNIAGSINYHSDEDKGFDVSFLNILAEANYTIDGFNSFYIGPHFGFSSIESKITGALAALGAQGEKNTEFIYGLQTGYNFPVHERFSLGLNARYSMTEVDGDSINLFSFGVSGSFFF